MNSELFKETVTQLLGALRSYVNDNLKTDDELALQSDVIFHKINELRKETNNVTDTDMKD